MKQELLNRFAAAALVAEVAFMTYHVQPQWADAAQHTAVPMPETASAFARENMMKVESLQRDFAITLRVFEAGEHIPDSQIGRKQSIYDLPTEWDAERLHMMASFLPNIPSHLYARRNDGEHITFVLGIVSAQGESPHEIILGVSDFTAGHQKEAFGVLVHELLHENDPVYSLETPMVVDGMEIRKWSPWYDTVETILGKQFAVFRNEQKAMVEEKITVMNTRRKDLTTEEQDTLRFYKYYYYGLGFETNIGDILAPIPQEFVAILGEEYVNGRAVFFARYTDFLPEPIVEQLYDFMKDAVFRGIEYGE